jgi:predicted nucleic acid-binding protein
MILADTSIWIDHLRCNGHPHLIVLLEKNSVWVHPWIVGEIACGNLAHRVRVLRELQKLPQLRVAREHEVLFLIERHRLMGKGIGYIDAHLLTAVLANGFRLWTRDKRLMAISAKLGILYSLPLFDRREGH